MAHIPIMLLLAGATAAVGAAGAIKQGQAQAASYKSEQAAANYNATIQAQNATTARQQSNAREEVQRRQTRQFLGRQAAAIGQSGTGLGGSNADVYGQSAANAELDALNIRYEGELDARGLLAQSELSRYSGKVAGMNAKSAKSGSYWSAASSLLNGASTYYGSRS